MPSNLSGKTVEDKSVVDVVATSNELTIKQRAGDAANRWLEKNKSLVLRQTPVWAQSFAVLLVSLGSIALAGGIFFRIDEVVTVGGQLKSIGGTVEVMTPAGGRVAKVFFSDGEVVQKGQLLLKFDTRRAASQKNMLIKQIEFENQQLQTQLQALKSQERTINGRYEVLKQSLSTRKAILEDMKSLVDQGGFQRLQYLERRDQIFGLQRQITDTQEQMSRINLESQRLTLQSRKSIDQMKTELNNAELQLQYQNVVAPVSGIVFDPKVRAESVLASGQRILSIVSQGGLYAEVFVPNKDIGYIKPQQNAKVRVDAFPFTRYGEIAAKVSQIAADALPPNETQPFFRYPVKLKLERSTLSSDGVSIPLKPGMAITTNLKLRDKRVISLVSDIFVDQTDSIRSLRQQ